MSKQLRKKGVMIGVTIIIILILFISLFSLYFVYIKSSNDKKDKDDSNKNIILLTPEEKEENISIVTLGQDEIESINSEIKPEDHVEKPIIVNQEIINATKTKEELANELAASEHDYFILQFIGPIKEEWKITLEKMNVVFYEYIPEYSYKIKTQPEQIPEILKLNFVNNIIEYKPELKIVKNTQEKIETLKKSEEIILYIETFKESSQLKAVLEEYGESYVQESSTSFRVNIEKSNINKLMNIEEINIIEEVQPVTITNDFASDIIEVDSTGNTLHLNGSGQIVGIIDSGIDTGVDSLTTEGDIHLDFDNRIVNISLISNSLCQLYGASCTSADDVNGHGTHTSGSIFSNGTQSSGQYRGMAYAANLAFYGAGDDAGSKSVYVSGLDTTMIQTLYNDGARTETNSWGSSITEYSNALAKRLDAFMWDNRDILILNSAGNDGPGLQTVRDPGTAKNIITVGASQSNRSGGSVNTIASFSSRGPANDGRIKPDVVAPGTNIVSTRSSQLGGSTQSCSSAISGNNYYSTCSGTSMASPIAAGYAALVRENLIENLGYDSPRASLIKAMIINGAQDIGYGIPSNVTGWGRINLTNTLTPPYPRYFKYIDNTTGFTSSGQYNTHTFSVVNNSNSNNQAMLKITLVWTDFESSASASTNLVNDLDLIVTSPNSTKYYGNNFAWPYNGSQDRLNNIEMLILNSSTNEVETGTYTINVSAYSISQTTQEYSLIISGGLNVSSVSTKFDGVTTNFGNLQNLYNKTGVILENTTNGKIVWNGYGYFSDMNFDRNVIFALNNLYVNASGLHSTLATNVTVSLYNVSFAMPMPLKDGVVCDTCQIVNSTQGRVDFYTIGFSNYSSAENTSLDIWDVLDAGKLNSTTIKYQNEEVHFFANYTNFSSSLPVTSATCNITFNDTSSKFTMSYNSDMKYYQYNRTFTNATLYSYNITCVATNYYQRTSTNTTTISDSGAVYPWQPTNHIIVLNSNGSVTLSWNKTTNAGSYGIIYDSNVTLLWEFASNATANITTSELNYTDTTINAITQTNNVVQRYYKIIAMNSTARVNASNTTLGIFKKEIPVTTGNPNTGVEQVIISVPLNVSNLSLSALIPLSSASNSDVIYTYNTTTNQPESVQFFNGFGWFGDFNMFNINQGYIFKPVASAYNITFVGFVPVTNSSFTLRNATNMAGNTTNAGSAGELNLIGLNTVQEKCDLDTIFYGASSGDMLFRYNTATAKYQTASYTASWLGDFDCINAGEGYEMRVVGNQYDVNYRR